MILRIFSIVFPVFAIAAIGYFYGRYKRPDMALANQLNMDLFVPALVFGALANKSFDLGEYKWLALAAALVILGSGLLAAPFARLLKVDYRTFVPPMMFNNSGNMGLPLAVLAFGQKALPAAIILFIVEMALHFSLGAYILDHRMRLTRMLRIPVIVATLLGLAVSASGLSLPAPVATTIKMLGDIAIPLLLFSLGVRLTEVSFKDWHLGLWGAILCPATGLAMVWLLSLWLTLPPLQHSLLIIFGALPPAVLNYIVAEQYRQEPEKVASIVMLANLGSLVVMPIALAVALR
ncbi:MAG TPA: AEC family transporter [Gammaproteobacteria bacterium]|nr:AEC family transporter [Gammaproteobacteria bacterium]